MKAIPLLQVLFWLLLLSQSVQGNDIAFEERVREISSELRCVVCQNLSVADSPSEMATQMRGIVREQLNQGKSAAAIKAYFVSKYGDWVLLAPPRSGFSLTVWILPFVVLVLGLLWAIWTLWRWTRRKPTLANEPLDPVLVQRIRDEIASDQIPTTQSGASLSSVRRRAYTDLRELELDYQAGKLSRSDYEALRNVYERQAATILADETNQEPPPMPNTTRKQGRDDAHTPVARRRWTLAVAAVVLLAGGIAVGLLLGQSLRPRTSTEDSITGDFLTGTDKQNSPGTRPADLNELLNKGRIAFEKKELKKAIESFKAVLSTDPDNPVANAYMGLILAQAGHAEAALLALDRALSRAPRLPVALWAKGMILYREKRDLAGAREHLLALVRQLPPGEERESIQGTIAQIETETAASGQTDTAAGESTLTGTVVIDPKVLDQVDPDAVLFIIARTPGSKRGPPLAVQRVVNPMFPLNFTLGPSNIMIPGTPFKGAVDLIVRLDKDGNPMTREGGSLTGVYRNNPVAVGSDALEIVIDQRVGE